MRYWTAKKKVVLLKARQALCLIWWGSGVKGKEGEYGKKGDKEEEDKMKRTRKRRMRGWRRMRGAGWRKGWEGNQQINLQNITLHKIALYMLVTFYMTVFFMETVIYLVKHVYSFYIKQINYLSICTLCNFPQVILCSCCYSIKKNFLGDSASKSHTHAVKKLFRCVQILFFRQILGITQTFTTRYYRHLYPNTNNKCHLHTAT